MLSRMCFGFLFFCFFVLSLSLLSLRPPATRVNDKVMIPQDEYPEINFVGLLIGPR